MLFVTNLIYRLNTEEKLVRNLLMENTPNVKSEFYILSSSPILRLLPYKIHDKTSFSGVEITSPIFSRINLFGTNSLGVTFLEIQSSVLRV